MYYKMVEFIVLDLVARGSAFVKLLDNDRMHRLFSHFLGDTCILYSFTSTILRPDQKHYTCEIHTDTPRLIPDYHLGMLMTLALDDDHRDVGEPEAEYHDPHRAEQLRGDAFIQHRSPFGRATPAI